MIKTATGFSGNADRDLPPTVGADSVGERQCDASVLAGAELIVVDSFAQASVLGERQFAVAEGTMPESVPELGELLLHPDLAATKGIRLCDLTGLGAYDAAVAALALDQGTRGQP